MMNDLFISVLNMSLTASYVILFVILMRLPLKKAPKFISYAIWGVVAFRLIIPFSFESMFSLMPRDTNAVLIPNDIYQQSPQINSGIEGVDFFVSESLPAPTIETSVNPLQIYTEIGAYIWILGIMALLVYSVVSIFVLKKQLKSAQLIDKDILEAKNLKTPFVLGIVRPKIYLPVGLSATERSYVLLHEQTHIHRKDHIIKILAFLVLSIHWFNPFVWAAFILMNKDMELSCDEKVLKEMNEDIKKPYAKSLLSLATGRHILNGRPLAFGEGNVKVRIKNVLSYKRPRFWVITMGIIVVIAITIGLISNPRSITSSMMWAKSLQAEDIESIELIVQPSSQQERYKKYERSEFPEIVKLINQSSGRVIKNPEYMAGGAQTFYITTKDGVIHRFTNNGYLIIDGDTFEARYDWLSKWDYKGTSNIPDGFWERVELKSTSYRLMQLKNGEVSRTISQLSEDNSKIAEDIIMNYMIKSAAWPGIDINTLEECYLLHVTYSDGTTAEYYAYLHDGRAVMQYGTEGQYSIISDGLYEKLAKLVSSGTTSVQELQSFPQGTAFEPAAPALLPDQSLGVGMPELDYASDNIVIFHGYFGLFVYDLNTLQIIRSIDLKPLKCHQTQGSNYCDVSVSVDGSIMYLHPMESENMYIYTVASHTFQEVPYQRMEKYFTSVPIEDVIDSTKLGIYSYNAARFDTGDYGYLYTSDWTLGTLSYVRGDMMYALFENNMIDNIDETKYFDKQSSLIPLYP